jgi:23S rRNA (cytidine1920-2'-O)/16S rRNA (cytidine1409-2'-O)-methyltransferase
MARKKRRMTTLRSRVAELVEHAHEAEARIASGAVLVGGSVVTNPTSMVPADAPVAIADEHVLRGRRKLDAALERWTDLPVRDAVALDAGAAAGGFTQALLEGGARKVYAVEVGYGQLLGSLRQDARVVNLERVNVGELGPELVPDALDLVTLDLGYLALATGVPQLGTLRFAPAAELIALVKPMFELGLGSPPSDRATLDRAREAAARGIESAGWEVVDAIDSPLGGSKGARELFVRARRRAMT